MARFAVVPAVSLNESDLFATPFTITNNGYLSAYDVQIECAVISASTEPMIDGLRGVVVGAPNRKTRFSRPEDSVLALHPTKSVTRKCTFPFEASAPFTKADVAVVVSFSLGWFPFRQEEVFRFVAEKGAGAKTNWYAQPE